MSVSDDRWTCDRCTRTAVVIATPADTRAALEAIRQRHARAHRAADDLNDHLPPPGPAAIPRQRRRRSSSRTA